MSSEVVLAYEMNGEPLQPEHGAPLRVVAPGYIGARSVKWLGGITLQKEPSSNYYQAHAYKLFPPHVDEETADWEKGLMLGELPVNSVICQSLNEETVPTGPVSIRGYAITGGERSVERVGGYID
jgi:sulfite oxidase